MSIDFTRYPALVTAARHGLGEPTATVEVSADEADRVIALARFDHITGLLSQALVDGLATMHEPHQQKLMESWHQELRACVVLESLIVRTAETLDAAGVYFRLTKGAALAHLDYPDPSHRTFGDVDLIVHPNHWEGAITALTTAGCSRDTATLPGSYDDRYGKGATLTTPDGFQIDLHRRLAIGRFGVTSHMHDLFDGQAAIQLGGREVPVLTPEYRLLHACYHAALGGYRRLRAFRDVAQLILVTKADLDVTYAAAARWKASAVVTAAITETWDRLGLDPSASAYQEAVSTRIGRADARALRVFAEHRPFRAQALTALGRLGPIDTTRYLWALKPRAEMGAG